MAKAKLYRKARVFKQFGKRPINRLAKLHGKLDKPVVKNGMGYWSAMQEHKTKARRRAI